MPKVKYSQARGLHQVAGFGVEGLLRQVISQTAVVASNAISLTVEQSGALVLLDKDEAVTITLPQITAKDVGVTYTFVESLASDNLRSVVTAFDDDCIIGGFSQGFDAGSTDSTGTFAHKSFAIGAAVVRIKIDDNLANAGGGPGTHFTCTAIAEGNVAASGGDKAVWLLTGHFVAQAEAGTGAAFLATS